MAHQIMLMLSAADHFGGAGGYKLIAAKTGFAVTLMDGMGDALENPAEPSRGPYSAERRIRKNRRAPISSSKVSVS